MQNYARKEVIEIDSLSFRFDVIDTKTYKDIKEKPKSGCFIYGMYLEGCKWDYDQHRLEDSDPKKLFVELPLMHLVPVKNRKKPTTGIYEIPTYKVLSRSGTLLTTGHSTNFIMYMELSSNQVQAKWIKAGVGAFLALRY